MEGFAIGIEWDGDVVQLRVRGELDIAVADELSGRVQALAASSARVATVDLSEVTFIDSAGLRALLSADRSARDGDFRVVLVRASKPVRDVIEITGAHRMLRVENEPNGR